MVAPEILPPEPCVLAVARPHPFSLESHFVQFPLGLSIRAIVGPNAVAVCVELGGMTIPESMWECVRPKAGCAVVITRYPQGGAAKTIFRLIAFAALAVATVFTAGLAGFTAAAWLGGFTLTSATAGLLAAGVGLVGSLLINALIPPSTPGTADGGQSTNLLKGITGTANQINRYGVISCVLGTILYFPTYAALPWTEVLGDDQYLRCLFDLGYGDPDPADMKIGDTDLSEYTDVETEIGVNPALFSQDILEEPVGIPFVDGDLLTRTTGVAADEISIDIAYASGLFGVDDDGKTTTVTVSNRLEFRQTGTSGTWITVQSLSGVTLSTPAAFFTSYDGDLQVRNAERKAIRVGVRWKVDKGQYDVRFTRNGTDWGGASTDSRVGDMTWTVLRTIRYTAPSTTGTKKIALRIKATDQLSGNISQFNCVVSQPIPVWHPDTEAWVTEYTTNPAWIFRYMLTSCPANPRRVDVSRVNDLQIKRWGADCTAKGYTYATALSATTLYALLKEICAAGRASFDIRDTKYSVILDEEQTTPVQVFTPRNSWGFGGNRAFPDAVHALRVQFTNPEANYQQDERVVYDDGYGDPVMVDADPTLTLATKFEQLPIPGCVDADAAWRLGRYHLAVSRLRPNTYSWNADVENLVCSRGELVRFASDVIGVGKSWGRVKTLALDGDGNAIGLTMDEAMFAEEGESYAIGIRRQDKSYVVRPCSLAATGIDLYSCAFTPAIEGVNEGDLVTFGILDSDTIAVVITKIEPQSDFAAKMTAVDYASGVLTADAGTPPAWSSQITGQPWLEPPPVPEFVLVDSSQLLSSADDAGNTAVTVMLSLNAQQSGKTPVASTEIRHRRADTVGAWTNVTLPAGTQSIQLYGAFEREIEYQIEARNIGTNGAASDWVQVNHTVAAASLLPLPISYIEAYQLYYGIRVAWAVTGVQRPDTSYEVQRADDASGVPDASTWVTVANVSALTWTDGISDTVPHWYAVRAISGGLKSAWVNAVSQNAVDPVGGVPPSHDPSPGGPVTQLPGD